MQNEARMEKREEDRNGLHCLIVFQTSPFLLFVTFNIMLCLMRSCDLSFTSNFSSLIANKDA